MKNIKNKIQKIIIDTIIIIFGLLIYFSLMFALGLWRAKERANERAKERAKERANERAKERANEREILLFATTNKARMLYFEFDR